MPWYPHLPDIVLLSMPYKCTQIPLSWCCADTYKLWHSNARGFEIHLPPNPIIVLVQCALLKAPKMESHRKMRHFSEVISWRLHRIKLRMSIERVSRWTRSLWFFHLLQRNWSCKKSCRRQSKLSSYQENDRRILHRDTRDRDSTHVRNETLHFFIWRPRGARALEQIDDLWFEQLSHLFHNAMLVSTAMPALISVADKWWEIKIW